MWFCCNYAHCILSKLKAFIYLLLSMSIIHSFVIRWKVCAHIISAIGHNALDIFF